MLRLPDIVIRPATPRGSVDRAALQCDLLGCKKPPRGPKKETAPFRRIVEDTSVSSIYDQIPVPICLLDSSGIISSVNAEFTTMLTSSKSEKKINITDYLQLEAEREIFRIKLKEVCTHRYASPEFVGYFVTNIEAFREDETISFTSIPCSWSFAYSKALELVVATVNPFTRITQYKEPLAMESNDAHGEGASMERFGSDSDLFLNTIEMQTGDYLLMKKNSELSLAQENMIQQKRQFIRSVSHEIRSPLNVMSCGLQILRESLADRPSSVELLEDVSFACMLAVNVLDDLLTYQQIEGSSLTLSLAPRDFLNKVRLVCDKFKPHAAHTDVELVMVEPVNVSSILVNMDKDKIRQVLNNLFINALRFIPKGGKLTVRVIAEPLSGTVVVEVQDTGPGIPLERQAKLFVDNECISLVELQNGQGEGPGIFVTTKVVRMHGGKIGVKSAEDGSQGAVFFIELPVLHVELGPRKTVTRNVSVPIFEPISEHIMRRILVVDDVAMCRKIHSKIFHDHCDECVEATNGEEAVDLVRKSIIDAAPFDAILMDSSMPLMNGTTATKLIRELGFVGKIFGVTGNALLLDVEDFMTHGADAVYIKPLSKVHIVSILQKISSAA